MLTETDLPYNALPQTVKNSFEASLYAKWKIDDVDMLERPDAGTIYVLDVENGEQDADLHYTEGGILIKEVTDGNGLTTSIVPLLPPALLRNSFQRCIRERQSLR